jgi:23S rRNA pseudouridine1911/1915/1917 synthase
MVEADRASMRLDQYLAAAIDGLSRTAARRIVELGGVHISGRRVRRCAQPVQAGEMVEVYLDDLPAESFALRDELVIYKDRYLLAVNKPAGVETQPTPARYQGTLYASLLEYLRNPFRPLDRPALGMVQRLDRGTSGVIVFSIHPRFSSVAACASSI